MTASVRWKLSRLSSMSPAEVAWRLEDRLRLYGLARRRGRPAPPLPPIPGGVLAAFREAASPLVPGPDFATGLERTFPGERVRILAEAEAVLEGRLALFAGTLDLGPDPERWPWNRDPAGGPEVAPEFGPTLDYRDPSRVGDARRAWELGRHQFLAPVAQAAYLTGDARYAVFVVRVLEAWLEACPPYCGIQWVSALELALRSLSWGYALALVTRTPGFDVAVGEERLRGLLAAWAEQASYLRAHDSRHSSANNHRLGEAAGLAWAGLLLPFLPESADWRERGLGVLEEAFLAQTTPDGVTREHAFAYQHFVLDFVIAVEALARAKGRAVPPLVAGRLERVAAALASMTGDQGEVWPVGDGDEGRALHLGEPWATRVPASLECAAALLARSDVAAREPRARWLGLLPFPSEASARLSRTRPAPGTLERRAFAEGGYTVLAWDWQGRSARLLFDCGPLGLPPLFAHGHADALEVLLDVDGPRLVDPGTGAYHAEPALRNRLRATRAHNTVEVDGLDQAVQAGLFQWTHPMRARDRGTLGGDGGVVLRGRHDGYERLADPVVHERDVALWAPGVLVVVDRLMGRVRHRARVVWRTGDGVPGGLEPQPADDSVQGVIDWPDGFTLGFAAFGPPGARLRTLAPDKGAGASPVAGVAPAGAGEPVEWAPRFRAPRPCGLVEVVWQGELPATFVTIFAAPPLRVTREPGRGGSGYRVRSSHGESSWLVAEGDGPVEALGASRAGLRVSPVEASGRTLPPLVPILSTL